MTEKQNTVLILGAGLMQRPAIQFAKKNGFYTVVVDANSKAVCVNEADRFEPVDLKDKEGLLALAKTLDNLVAVFTAGTDFSASVAYVASNLGLNGHGYEACLNASNKIRMRTCFKAASVPSPDFVQITEKDIALYDDVKLASMSFPKVIKPVDNMGARGCRMIRDASEFAVAVEDAVKNSRSGCAILEDYMEGPEFSIDSIVHNGTLTITGFADRHIYYPPYFIETGHTMPTKIDEKQRLELIETFAKGVKALGLTEGAAKGDIKYTSKGPMIGEIAARLSGGYMSGWTYPYASDINLTEQALFIACGKEPEALLAGRVKLSTIKDSPFDLYDLPCKRTCAERAWISIPGIIESVTGYEKASAITGINDVLPRNKVGDEVDFPRNNVQKCGNVIAVGKTFEDAANIAASAVSSIVIRLKPFNEKTDAFLSGKELPFEKGFPPFAYPAANKKIQDNKISFKETIPENQSVIDFIPEDLLLIDEKDWNHRTIKQSLLKFDELCPMHKEFNVNCFVSNLLRAGLQGILYMNDCLNSSKI